MMIMAGLVQRFILYQAPGAFGAEWVCADGNCLAPMIGTGASEGSAEAAAMTHTDACQEVKTPRPGQQ